MSTPVPRAAFSHVGIHVHDLPGMEDFYTRFMGLVVTDRGPLDTSLGKANAADNLLALATGVMTAFVAARDLDHGGHRAYEVIFEENTDGRRRSRVQTFSLEHGPAGVALYGWHLFLDAEGDLQQSPVSYQSATVVLPHDVVLGHNPLDAEFTPSGVARIGALQFREQFAYIKP